MRFLRDILLLSMVLGALAIYPYLEWMGTSEREAFVAAGIIAFANIILGCLIIIYAIDKPNSPFMVAVFGGMGVRMFMILGALTILLKSGFQPLTLALSLMGFYVIYMIAEIAFVLRELGGRRAARIVTTQQAAARAGVGAGGAGAGGVDRFHSVLFEFERT